MLNLVITLVLTLAQWKKDGVIEYNKPTNALLYNKTLM
jgi:hypothetical protein